MNQQQHGTPNRNRGGWSGGRGGGNHRGKGQHSRATSNNSNDRRKSGGRKSIDTSINETLSLKLEKVSDFTFDVRPPTIYLVIFSQNV